MKRTVVVAVALGLGLSPLTPTHAHHVGVFTPKDDDITKNFKDIKFASQAGRFDVALKLFEEGVVHETMERFEKALPPRLEDHLRAALKTQDLPGVESRLALFLAFMTRERVRTAVGRLREPRLQSEQRREQARKLLDAAWRYYNLADFVISRQDPKASVTLRLAFEDAQSFLGGTMVDPMWATGRSAPGTTTPPGVSPKGVRPDDEKAAAALNLMEGTLDEVLRRG